MLDAANVDLHGKRHTDFDFSRILKAQAQGFDESVTAYLCGAFIGGRVGVGVVFGHEQQDLGGRFVDGVLIRTSDVLKAEKEGRFWVLSTADSRYVLATFQKGNGRSSLRNFLRLSSTIHQPPPALQ
ncbi:hypothetical protein IFT69_26575 [Pseudomonas putida]|nr:hypothetical protein [Pseudomonas putida]